jgi:hypothetical protein
VGELYLNMLPLTVAADPATMVARVWERDNAVDESLRANPVRGVEFEFNSYNKNTFAWALPGHTLPAELADRGDEASLPSMPAAVVASAVRNAAVRRLVDEGLELRSDRLGQPATLSRRKLNLAAHAFSNLPAGVGVYPVIAVQGVPLLGDGSEPGGVALIIDQSVAYILDVPLATLAAAGVVLMDARLHWQHQPGCGCEPGRAVGDAGRFLGGDPTGIVKYRDAGGDEQSAEAACLAVQSNSWMMAQYLATLNGRGERDIADALKQTVDAFNATKKRWSNLEKTGRVGRGPHCVRGRDRERALAVARAAEVACRGPAGTGGAAAGSGGEPELQLRGARAARQRGDRSSPPRPVRRGPAPH